MQRTFIFLSLFLMFSTSLFAQATGSLRGQVTLEGNNKPVHDVAITIVKLRMTTETDDNGNYEFKNVPVGTWSVHAHLEGFPDVVETVTIKSNSQNTADFSMTLKKLRDQVTISATGNEQSTFEAFQSVTSLDNIDLTEKGHPSLGDVLDKQPGVAKRSFGPGTTRPIIRGFSGDRVLVLQDGMQIGSIGAQSGDHGEPIDVLSLERVEIVKGPASLLYGNNAIGGVVNAITGHNMHMHPHGGVRGYVTGIGGTNNNQGGTSGGIEFGTEKLLFWGNGSFQRVGDYSAPQIGRIDNSEAHSGSGTGGFGYYGNKGFFSTSYSYDQRRFGIPFAGVFEGDPDAQIDLKMRKHSIGFNAGASDLNSKINSFRFSLNVNDYQHKELEIEDGIETVGTTFDNDLIVYRGVFEQKRHGALTGSFGFWGQHRNYETEGEEALTPPTRQTSAAVFGLQELRFERIGFQFGGRLESNRYAPSNGRARSFTGLSGAAGVRVPLWEGGAFVTNYTHSYRAPALEELYNFGPHPGNLTFEIGDINLRRERSDGVEVSVRHSAKRVRAEFNYFLYAMKDFIFLAPTGNIEDGLPEAEYGQADSRYQGYEARFDVNLAPMLWLNTGLDYVSAKLTETDQGLPRIPPLRGRIGIDLRHNGFSLRPELVMAKAQDSVFTNETRTAGYTVINLDFSYTFTQHHLAHVFSVNSFNLGDRLYRNHASLIKDLAPEIGRGVRFVYTLRFF